MSDIEGKAAKGAQPEYAELLRAARDRLADG
jgi:hypothetical protein